METKLHYQTGESVRVGDKVRHYGIDAVVVFISDGLDFFECVSGYEDWRGHECGFMLRHSNGALVFLDAPDEDIYFIAAA